MTTLHIDDDFAGKLLDNVRGCADAVNDLLQNEKVDEKLLKSAAWQLTVSAKKLQIILSEVVEFSSKIENGDAKLEHAQTILSILKENSL